MSEKISTLPFWVFCATFGAAYSGLAKASTTPSPINFLIVPPSDF